MGGEYVGKKDWQGGTKGGETKGGLKAERIRLSGRYDAEDADVTDMRVSVGDQILGGGVGMAGGLPSP